MPLATKRKVAPPAAISFNDPALYVNRELSLLEFQRRVLEEAQDPTNPLLERAKFLSILGSNLDEFFMVRVAGLLNQIESGTQETGSDGMPPARQLDAIRGVIEQLLADAYACLRGLVAELAAEGLSIKDFEDLTEEQKDAANQYF